MQTYTCHRCRFPYPQHLPNCPQCDHAQRPPAPPPDPAPVTQPAGDVLAPLPYSRGKRPRKTRSQRQREELEKVTPQQAKAALHRFYQTTGGKSRGLYSFNRFMVTHHLGGEENVRKLLDIPDGGVLPGDPQPE